MATLTVGSGSQFQFHTIAAAVAASQNGDVVLVQAGTYTNDFCDFSDSITLQAVGGMVVINATVAPSDGKAIITEGGTGVSVTISGFELTGAKVADNNGAGIRYQGGNLTLTNDYIFNNQEGILGNPAVAGDGTISISNCEFANNGDGSGGTHNIYIGNVATLSVSNSLIRGAVVGHQIKSRALNTIITNNVIADGPTGTASYCIDLSNGGNATITGNVIEKGPNTQNWGFISYGAEGVSNKGTSVTVSGNTILNDHGSATVFNNYSTNVITFANNQLYALSSSQLFNFEGKGGSSTGSGNTTLGSEPALNLTPPWSAAATLPGPTVLTLTAPSALSLGVGQPTTIGGVSLAETGNVTASSFTVTVTDGTGVLSASGTGVSGSGSSTLTVTGSLAQVNAGLATLTDTNATMTADTITLRASDNLGNSAAVATTAVTVVNVQTLTVGAGTQYQYHTIAAAVAAAGPDNDVILVQAGTYTNDFLTLNSSISLQAVGGMVVINATVAPPDGKAIITEGGTGVSVSISGFELTGAKVADNNGAGIRYQGGNLTLTGDYIFNNQEGILGNPAVAGDGTVAISNCEFANNGDGSGATHNIYIGNVATLSVSNSLIRGAVVGHQIKSRALNTIISNNVIADGTAGTGSYCIDLPNGGNATITGNVIEKGPKEQNPSFIAYGEEGVSNPGSSVAISGNTFLNDCTSSSVAAVWNNSTVAMVFSGNQVFKLSTGQIFKSGYGSGTVSNTTTLGTEPALNLTPPWTTATATPPPPSGSSSVAVTAVSVAPANADLGIGQKVTITVQLSAAVKVAGKPTLLLSGGGTASYSGGTGATSKLTFTYTVLSGQNTADLAVSGTCVPAGAGIADAGGNSVSLAGAVGALPGHLIVDTADTRTTITNTPMAAVNAGSGHDVVVVSGGSPSLSFNGSGNSAFLGGGTAPVNVTITDKSSGLTVYVLAGGKDVFNGFGNDPTAVVDLLGGIGGYKTAGDVVKALVSDGHGGCKLGLLGSTQYIDFAGVALGKLTEANFAIG